MDAHAYRIEKKEKRVRRKNNTWFIDEEPGRERGGRKIEAAPEKNMPTQGGRRAEEETSEIGNKGKRSAMNDKKRERNGSMHRTEGKGGKQTPKASGREVEKSLGAPALFKGKGA